MGRKPNRGPARKPTQEPTRAEILRSVRRIQREEGASWPPTPDDSEKKTIEYLAQLFSDAKFEVQRELELGARGMTDLIVGREFLGRHYRYFIHVALVREADDLIWAVDELSKTGAGRKIGDYEELWLVSNLSLSKEAEVRFRSRRMRALTSKEVERMLARLNPGPPRPRKEGKAKTKIGKAVEANEAEITVAITGLILQIDDKLAGLRNERPNDPDTITARDTRISDFERIRAELEIIREKVAAFTQGQAKEKEVVQSVTTFRDDIRGWWRKEHDAILTKTFDMGLFLSSVGILSMIKADLKTAMIVSGTLIGGKTIGGALKGVKKKILGD